ncbi:MAG: hypothetical protein PVG92_00015 [Holophagae bacterium]|jgi:hypothetical protein
MVIDIDVAGEQIGIADQGRDGISVSKMALHDFEVGFKVIEACAVQRGD